VVNLIDIEEKGNLGPPLWVIQGAKPILALGCNKCCIATWL